MRSNNLLYFIDSSWIVLVWEECLCWSLVHTNSHNIHSKYLLSKMLYSLCLNWLNKILILNVVSNAGFVLFLFTSIPLLSSRKKNDPKVNMKRMEWNDESGWKHYNETIKSNRRKDHWIDLLLGSNRWLLIEEKHHRFIGCLSWNKTPNEAKQLFARGIFP